MPILSGIIEKLAKGSKHLETNISHLTTSKIAQYLLQKIFGEADSNLTTNKSHSIDD